jgi:hypothetical protein
LIGKPPNRIRDASAANGDASRCMPARGGHPGSLLAIGRYALAWIAAAALVVGLTRVLSDDQPSPVPVVDPVAHAAQQGGCVLRSDAGGATSRDLDVAQPPTFGPPAAPAVTGVYRRAPRTEAVVGSLRRGTVVLQYRAGTPRSTVEELRRLFARAPFESILTPDRTGMRYAVAATAWGRLLGCPRANRRAMAAVNEFALRYRGRGPDAGR